LNIVHVIVGLNGGGAEHFLYRLSLQQMKSENTITIISLTDFGSIGYKFIAAGIDVQCLELSSLASIPKAIFKLRKIIKNINPDVVQSWMYHADLFTSIALIGKKINLVWSVRCSFVPAGSRLTFLIMKFCACISRFVPKKIVYVATAARENHTKHGYSACNTVVIPNGFDFSSLLFSFDKRLMYRTQLGLSADTLLLGMVGRYHHDKGQDLLINAFQLVKRHRSNIKLLLIGNGCSSENSILVKLLIDYDLLNDVFLIGEQHDVSGWLSCVDIYVMSSRTEGFPNALAEALAIGLPTVATTVGDAKLVAANHAFYCEPNPSSLACAITDAASIPFIKRVEIGNNGKQHVINSFSIEEIEKKYHKLYLSLMEL
jgi:glycosyltransferase involved in cell wall biosynthesis